MTQRNDESARRGEKSEQASQAAKEVDESAGARLLVAVCVHVCTSAGWSAAAAAAAALPCEASAADRQAEAAVDRNESALAAVPVYVRMRPRTRWLSGRPRARRPRWAVAQAGDARGPAAAAARNQPRIQTAWSAPWPVAAATEEGTMRWRYHCLCACCSTRLPPPPPPVRGSRARPTPRMAAREWQAAEAMRRDTETEETIATKVSSVPLVATATRPDCL